ncbi:amino acid/polyamine/organocation transporter, APC superfamily [Pricia antarctica]|uniref:Amino acid/polyamine/organocation transporter, APC superfamily n=1 Tax=Pricia antarctica TaxID=641691 RepID=A0A1G7ACY9_9FLAO|nr:amino acid permease [Pricia antarctica]SDE12681.1 amino acid/polyamine/organocation transporter, APC superfamily [Pricia antarctica]
MAKLSRTYQITTLTGVALVVANMIGTGAFTSLGFQLKDLQNPTIILILWVLGGLIALSGAYSYAEIGTHIQKSGGEYAFLTKLFHPLIGYLSGWISITVGFAAPIALSAMAFVAYFPFFNLDPKWASIVLVALITLIHTRSLEVSSKFQNISTILKIALIVVLIGIGLWQIPSFDNVGVLKNTDYSNLMSPAFAVALIYVSYSYSGWNAAAYITEEFKNPQKSLPIALIGGTLLVTVLYTLLQYVFLKHVPIADLKGQLNVGTIAMNRMIGENYGKMFGLAISLLLVSGISAMVWVGSRVTSSIAKDHRFWRYFKPKKNTIPQKALWLQFAISAFLILTGTFEQILIYCGILLTISSMATVLGVFKLRYSYKKTQTHRYKSPLFPLFQIIFIILSLWMIVYAFINSPVEIIVGFGNLLIGFLTYWWSIQLNKNSKT